MAINPDRIQAGDQLTLSVSGGAPTEWTVTKRSGIELLVSSKIGDVKLVKLGAKRADVQILDHRPWLQ